MARAADDLFAGIVERAGRLVLLQRTLERMPTPAARKQRIVDLCLAGVIDDDLGAYLIQAYQLETA